MSDSAENTNNVSIFTFHSEEEFWQSAKEDVILIIKETLEKHKTCRIALAGGSTPKILYSMLAEEDLAWEKIIFIQLDERYVPSDHAQSNLKMLREALLKKIALPPENLIAFDTSLPIESSAKEMSRKLIELSHERFPLIDLLILGAGSDGHIASLFEGDEALSSHHYATHAHAEGQQVEERLTLSILTLKSAAKGLLLLKGKEKELVVKSLQGQGDLPLTALRELAEDRTVKVLYLEGN